MGARVAWVFRCAPYWFAYSIKVIAIPEAANDEAAPPHVA